MVYRGKAEIRESEAAAFYRALTDGTIQQQKPDGAEIVSAMRAAKITAPGRVEWYGTCFCESPLKHERETVYDKYLADITTEPMEDYGAVHGGSFLSCLEDAASG